MTRMTVKHMGFCECVRPRGHRAAPAPLTRGAWTSPSPAATVHRVHWTIAGWIIGLTLIIIDGTAPADGR